jgi:hypothetical protein
VTNAQTARACLDDAREDGADRATWGLAAAQVYAILAVAEELARLVRVLQDRRP